MRRFVMGDLHGNCTALRECLEKADFDKQNDQLIQLGDVVDGGPDAYACVEELLTIPHLVAVRGNHDAWLHNFIKTGFHPVGWTFGGKATAQSYLRLTGRQNLIRKTGNGYKTALDPYDTPATHREFFRRQVPWYIDAHNNCFVHAGFNRHEPFDRQRNTLYYWDRNLWHDALAQKDSFAPATAFNHIFTGHTSTLHWHTDQPMKAWNMYNLDTGAGSGGRLTMMNIDTNECYQSAPTLNREILSLCCLDSRS